MESYAPNVAIRQFLPQILVQFAGEERLLLYLCNINRLCLWQLTVWFWSWKFTVQHAIYVKCEYFMNQEG